MPFNAPSLFRVAQGAAPTPRYGPVVTPRPMLPGMTGGGNMPMVYGYDGVELKEEDWVNAPPGSPGSIGGPDPTAATQDDYFISAVAHDRGLTFDEADAIWRSMSEDDKNLVRGALRRDLSPGGGGSGDGLAGTYAQIAENARQFNEQMAFDRARAEQQDKIARWEAEVTRQKAMQDFESARDQAKVARKQLFNDAATAAIGAHQAGLGQARIAGIENFRLDGSGGNPLANAPIVGFNPSLTYGEQLEAPAEMNAPNMPGVNF